MTTGRVQDEARQAVEHGARRARLPVKAPGVAGQSIPSRTGSSGGGGGHRTRTRTRTRPLSHTRSRVALSVDGVRPSRVLTSTRSRNSLTPTPTPKQFEWAWQNPHASRHLHALQYPGAQFPRTALSNRPLTKVQVLQFMLCSAPWASFNLEVTLFCTEAELWWSEARRLGPTVRTEAARRAWEKAAGYRTGEQWGWMAPRLDRVKVNVKRDGVDGCRGRPAVLEGEEDEGPEPFKMTAHDGAPPAPRFSTPAAKASC